MDDKLTAVRALILAIPESAGSALYGMYDVLGAAGNLWQALVRTEPAQHLITPRIIAPTKKTFRCGNNIPVSPDFSIKDNPETDIIIVTEFWINPEDNIKGKYPETMKWLREQHKKGVYIYSACSGSIILAESGLLENKKATSHWGFEPLFKKHYPNVSFDAAPNLAFADIKGSIVTAGGTTSWHDLAIHIIAKHCSTGEAAKVAKAYLMKWHDEGQMPFTSLVTSSSHADSVVRQSELWLAKHYKEQNCVSRVVDNSKIPERSIKRRFKAATGKTIIERVQNLRIEEAKRILESSSEPVENICNLVGYEEAPFFRRLFKRLTGLTPSQYRQMFKHINTA